MALKLYVFAFLTLWSLLCVNSALEEGGRIASLEKNEVKEQILRLPSKGERKRQATIPWEQSPIQIRSLRFPWRPIIQEQREMGMEDHPNFQQVRVRPVRFRFGRPGGCHGKFKQFLMSREDPSQPQFLRRMGMGHFRHAYVDVHPRMFPAIEDLGNDGKTSFKTLDANLNPEREEMGFEKHTEKEKEENENEAPWMAWVRSIFN